MPSVYVATAFTAARMSRTRKRQSRKRSLAWRSSYAGLAWAAVRRHGRLRDDLVAHLGAQGARGGEVDPRVHDVREEVEQAHVGEEADRRARLELHQEVDVAVRVAWSRAVDPNTAM